MAFTTSLPIIGIILLIGCFTHNVITGKWRLFFFSLEPFDKKKKKEKKKENQQLIYNGGRGWVGGAAKMVSWSDDSCHIVDWFRMSVYKAIIFMS